MIIEIKQPNITQYFLRFDVKDNPDMYYRRMWARINLDHDTYTMTATSDCGDFSYSWCCTPDSESFIKLMARINSDYLLGKISSETEFNLEESKKETIENLQCIDDSELSEYNSIKTMEAEINDIEEQDERFFYDRVVEITENRLDFECIAIIKEYPKRAETFCEIFCKYFQPVLKEVRRNKRVQEWLSVDVRLPEAGETVLAYVKHNYADDGFRAYRVYEYDGHWVGMGNLCEVTHWMPLPEPPKGADNNG